MLKLLDALGQEHGEHTVGERMEEKLYVKLFIFPKFL